MTQGPMATIALTSERNLPPAAAARPLVLHARVVAGTGGGPDKTILNSPRRLRELGFDCQCLYLRPPGDQRKNEPLRPAPTPGRQEYTARTAALVAPRPFH